MPIAEREKSPASKARPLHVKDPKAHQLASEIAEATGKSLTQVVIDALVRERRAIVSNPRNIDLKKVDEILASLQEMHAGGRPLEDIMDELYDENGLPK